MKITGAAAAAWGDAQKPREPVGAFILSDGSRTASWVVAHQDWAKDPENVRRFREGLIKAVSQPSPLSKYLARKPLSDRMEVGDDE